MYIDTFYRMPAYSQQQSDLAREFMSFAQAQDDPIVGNVGFMLWIYTIDS